MALDRRPIPFASFRSTWTGMMSKERPPPGGTLPNRALAWNFRPDSSRIGRIGNFERAKPGGSIHRDSLRAWLASEKCSFDVPDSSRTSTRGIGFREKSRFQVPSANGFRLRMHAFGRSQLERAAKSLLSSVAVRERLPKENLPSRGNGAKRSRKPASSSSARRAGRRGRAERRQRSRALQSGSLGQVRCCRGGKPGRCAPDPSRVGDGSA